MIKVSDYVTRFLVERGVKDVFLVTGGGIMHLTDSVGRQAGLRYWCNHHEQACAIAAESYARRTGGVGAILVTTGPGSTNALSAIAGAWVDSIPVFVVSGQVRRDLIADYSRRRQVGPQEINIDAMARPVTKYFVTVMDPLRIRAELETAWHAATTGRPGPVWVNVPLDVQGAMVDESDLAPARIAADEVPPAGRAIDEILDLVSRSRRPLWVFGQGAHLAGVADQVPALVRASGFPAVLTIGGMDLLTDDDPLNAGRFGPVGQRRANFAVQNADLLVVAGASLSIASIGFNTDGFAPGARKIVVDVDPVELDKPRLELDLAVRADLRTFIPEVREALRGAEATRFSPWIAACADWKKRYPTVTEDYLANPEYVNSYVLARALSDALGEGDTVIAGNSLDVLSLYQSFRVKPRQRVYTNINFGAMGWDLPAAVGAAVASPESRTILFTGDGSLQFNMQELSTIKQYSPNIKIFVLNNKGYEAIRATQRNYFEGRLVGCDPSSGVGNPDYQKLAQAYGMKFAHLGRSTDLPSRLLTFLAEDGPGLCEVSVWPDQPRSPKTASARRADGTMESRPLEDMWPFLPREQVAAEMRLSREDPSAHPAAPLRG